jgi:hypothetical protein
MKEGDNRFSVGGASLPRPELNPLTNPVLGRNLGRWAQVYFTAPPEQREQAVSQLLRELEAEPETVSAGERVLSAREADASPVFTALREARDSVAPAAQTPAIQTPVVQPDDIECVQCRHVNSADNRFCGFCGGALGEAAETEQPPPSPVAPPARIERDNELEWLRNKELASFQMDQGRGLGWVKYLLAVAAMAIAGLLYFQFRDRVSTSLQSSTTPASQPAVQTPEPARPEKALPEHKNDKHLIQAASLKKEQPRAIPPPTPPAEAAKPANATASGATDPDVRLAQTYLQQRNGPEAARLLWKAVGRNNTDAALTLSQMYARGDGVSRSCDQARILLVAAAKRGSAAAAQQLRQFDSAVCR